MLVGLVLVAGLAGLLGLAGVAEGGLLGVGVWGTVEQGDSVRVHPRAVGWASVIALIGFGVGAVVITDGTASPLARLAHAGPSVRWRTSSERAATTVVPLALTVRASVGRPPATTPTTTPPPDSANTSPLPVSTTTLHSVP